MNIDKDEEVVREMVRKDYVVFAPKSDRDLRRDYTELWDYPALAKLSNPSEVLFCWWYAIRCSPIIELPDEKRFPIAVEQSFKGRRADEIKKMYAAPGQAPSLPEEWKAACKVMSGFNPAMRIQMAVDNLFALRECQRHIRQENRGGQEDRQDYLKTLKIAREIQRDILKDIERGNYGVEEKKNTTLENLEGIASQFHKQQVRR
ncbi:MAG TPA: hypothetical protein PKJ19_04350 [Flavobacteriales bacterium]|nr:hypothetical protein [Flavobacteriales bacterium]